MLSALGETCDDACFRNAKGQCYVEGMRAITDFTQFTYLAEKLLGSGGYTCESQDSSASVFSPGVSPEFKQCRLNGIESDCGRKNGYAKRFCCCSHDSSSCPIED